MTPFGRVAAGLIGLVVLVALAGLAWFGFRFVQDEILDGQTEGNPEDTALFEQELARCVAIATIAKGFKRQTYRQFKAENPHCARLVTFRVWQAL